MTIAIYKNWRSLIKPKYVETDKEKHTDSFAKFVVKPLERGFGLTLGNALRRILLSSLQGAAITSIKIDGVDHEFSTLPGMQEDVINVILNLKKVRLKLLENETATLSLDVKGPATVTAGQIDTKGEVEILNPDHVIAHLADEAHLRMDITVKLGKGFVLSEEHKKDVQAPIGTIFLDSHFSPIEKVNYIVTNARVGQVTDYDRLTLEIQTNGSISPEDSVAYAAKILKDQVQVFINFDEYEEPEEIPSISQESMPLNENLNRRVDELELSVRSANCLQNANIRFIGELVQKTEAEMLRTKNFGRKSLNEIQEVLTEMGLGLGMKIDGWVMPVVEDAVPVDQDQIDQELEAEGDEI